MGCRHEWGHKEQRLKRQLGMPDPTPSVAWFLDASPARVQPNMLSPNADRNLSGNLGWKDNRHSKRFSKKENPMVLYRIAVAILALVLGLGANREILEGAGSDKLNVGWGSISGTQAGLWVAKEKGLFEKQGLDVTLIYIPGGPRPVMAMLGGTIQLLSFSSLPSFEAYLKGADTVIIGSTL